MTTMDAAPDRADAAVAQGSRERLVDILRFWLTFSACLALLMFRGWERLSQPDLFAEGVRFVGGAVNEGWLTLLSPYDFYLHTAPKLVALLALSVAPLEQLPLFTNLVCYAVTAGAIAGMSRPGFRWLIPSDGARVALSLLMVLAPGLIEVLGNLPNLHWSLLLLLAMLLIKDPKHSFTAWELGLAALAMLSSASVVVLLPVAFLRLLFAWRRHPVRPYEPLLGLGRLRGEAALFSMLLLVTVYLFANFLTKDASVGTEGLDIVGAARGLNDLLPQLGALFATFYFLHPFLGTQNTTDFLQWVSFYPLIATAIVVVVLMLYRLWRVMDYRFWIIPAWLGSLLLLAIMLSIVRYWSFYGIFSFPYENWWFRYNFFFASSGLIFWFVLLRVRNITDIHRWPVILMWVLVVGYFFQARAVTTDAAPPHDTDAFTVYRYGEKSYWSRSADELERALETGCPARVEVKGAPGGKWRFVYESPRTAEDCAED